MKYVEGLWKEEHLNLLKAWKRGMGGDLDLALTGKSCRELELDVDLGGIGVVVK